MHIVFFQDYFDIVKNPMDLSTIKRKLDTGLYNWDDFFCRSVNVMFGKRVLDLSKIKFMINLVEIKMSLYPLIEMHSIIYSFIALLCWSVLK